MKVAIIGSGNIAKVHEPAILSQPNAKIVGICDKDIARAKATAKELKIDHFYQDATTMVEEQKPDVVHILTPPQYHAQLSIMAMNKGCHVLVEKPMALSVESAERMIKVAKENNVKICVNHNLVFANVIQKAFKLVSQGSIGKPVSVEACFMFDARRYPAILEEGAEYCHWSYQMNGGPLQDQLPHPASLVFELIDQISEIQFINQSRGILPQGWHDELRVLINSDNVMGFIGISLREKPDTITFTIKGTKGILHADFFNDILTMRKKSYLPRAAARGLSGFQFSAQYLNGFLTNIYKFIRGRVDKSNGIEPLVSAFYKSILDGTSPPISTEKSLRVVELMTRIWPSPIVERTEEDIQPTTTVTSLKPTILVTGASGFIGTHLIKKLLSKNIAVRALVRPNSIHAGRLKALDVEVFEGDLSDADILFEATKDIKTIYHAGSPMGNDRSEYEEVAVRGTEHLINAGLTHKVERFVLFSSLTVYELLKIKAKNINENSPYQHSPDRMGAYAWAKIEIEKRVFDAYHKDGLAVTVVRPGIVIGPFCRVFFPHLGYNLQEQVFLMIGKGDTILPLTYVENTVDGIYLAGTIDKAIGQAYNLIDDGQITARKYIEEFIRIAGNSRKIVKLPYVVPYSATLAYEVAAFLGLVKKGVTSRAQLKWKQSKVRFDNTKAKSELGWAPKISLEEGLTRTFKWYALKYSPKE